MSDASEMVSGRSAASRLRRRRTGWIFFAFVFGNQSQVTYYIGTSRHNFNSLPLGAVPADRFVSARNPEPSVAAVGTGNAGACASSAGNRRPGLFRAQTMRSLRGSTRRCPRILQSVNAVSCDA